MAARRVIVEGRVQGVGFRYAVKDLARGFDVCGWVRNLDDGTVEIQMMGEGHELDSFLREISQESSVAHHIQKLTSSIIEPMRNVTGFTITR